MAISRHDALCCLLAAASTLADDNDAPFVHVYPSLGLSLPLCAHDAAVGTWSGEPEEPPPGPPGFDNDLLDQVRYDLFTLRVVRPAPPMPSPDLESTVCLENVMGNCNSTSRHTLAGHHRLVMAETEWLRAGLLDAWCECLRTFGGLYSAGWLRWISTLEVSNQGRFTVIEIKAAAQLG